MGLCAGERARGRASAKSNKSISIFSASASEYYYYYYYMPNLHMSSPISLLFVVAYRLHRCRSCWLVQHVDVGFVAHAHHIERSHQFVRSALKEEREREAAHCNYCSQLRHSLTNLQ